jgi:ubiquinone/menaquinone biosynthesis C-methylase UbiE
MPSEHSLQPEIATSANGPIRTHYALDNNAPQTADRFAALTAIFDAGTIRHLEERAVASGWKCLEVGGGSGTIAAWLSKRVGPTGRVVVTDINTRFLEHLKQPNVEVLQHNIIADELPDAAFDLVHARLVLMHLPDPNVVLRRLIKALKPGGWLVDEEFDAISLLPDENVNPKEAELKTTLALTRVLANRGVDLRFGRLLFRQLRALGLSDVGAQARLSMGAGASIEASLIRSNFEQLREELIAAGSVSAQEFEHDLKRLNDPDSLLLTPTMWAAWGRLAT